jgi:hypothetical protein
LGFLKQEREPISGNSKYEYGFAKIKRLLKKNEQKMLKKLAKTHLKIKFLENVLQI